MSQNLYNAYRQWVARPSDERFYGFDNFHNFLKARKDNSDENIISLDQVAIGNTPEGAITINGDSQPATFSNWAFGQMCRVIGAPAKYLRTLPLETVKDCLFHGLKSSNSKSLLLTRNETTKTLGNSYLWASAFTGPSYGRIWDADVAESLINAIAGSPWHLPADYDNEASGLYASDHDMFAFLINDEEPTNIGNARLGRGFFCWNSETGASTFGLTTFLYNHVCKNHIVWGAEYIKELRIIHKNNAPHRFYTQAIPALNTFIDNKQITSDLEETVNRAMNQRIGNTLDDVIKWFDNKPFTRTEITKAWDTGFKENEDVTSKWGIIQGLTAYAREIPFIDKKVNLERRAGALLK